MRQEINSISDLGKGPPATGNQPIFTTTGWRNDLGPRGLSVDAFGAAGDGLTDDSDAIHHTIDVATVIGYSVPIDFGAKEYCCNLALIENTTLRGIKLYRGSGAHGTRLRGFSNTLPTVQLAPGTTGSVTAGSNQLTVVSTRGFVIGGTILVRGAGAAGAFFTGTITAINGLVITLSANASTTVTNAMVTLNTYRTGFEIADMQILGGKYGIASFAAANHIELRNVAVGSQVSAGVYFEGWVEKMLVQHCDFTAPGVGTGYAWQHARTNGPGNLCYIDKVNFRLCEFAGGVNAVRFEVFIGDEISWMNCRFNSCSSHGFYWDGGCNAMAFYTCTTEGVGQGGKNNRTTGDITTGTNSLVVASATGYVVGDAITVQGAGAFGADLFSVVDVIAGTTLTLHDNASTTVTGLAVTNATADCYFFNNTNGQPSGVAWYASWVAGEGTGGKQRYAINAEKAFSFVVNACISANNIPIYDPNITVFSSGGQVTHRRPFTLAGHPMRYNVFAGPGAGEVLAHTMLVSPPGKPSIMVLRDSLDNMTGTFDNFEVRKNDPNKTRLLRVEGTTFDVVQERSTGKLRSFGTMYIDPKANPATCTKGEMNIGTDGKLYVCSATNTWTAQT